MPVLFKVNVTKLHSKFYYEVIYFEFCIRINFLIIILLYFKVRDAPCSMNCSSYAITRLVANYVLDYDALVVTVFTIVAEIVNAPLGNATS